MLCKNYRSSDVMHLSILIPGGKGAALGGDLTKKLKIGSNARWWGILR